MSWLPKEQIDCQFWRTVAEAFAVTARNGDYLSASPGCGSW
jgi:hypothetical protein